jgi:hypothetical protein
MGRNYSLGDGARNNTASNKNDSKSAIMFLCTVLNWEDKERAGRIKVRIKGKDDKKLDSELPEVWPFLPLYLNIVPKPGEIVKIILYDSKNEDSYREYIGPVVPQMGEKLIGIDSPTEGKAGREGEVVPFYQSIKTIPTVKDTYPGEYEIALQGRNNADLIFKDSEVMVRAAKFLPNKPNVKNEKNPAYIQIKTLNPGKYEEDVNVQSSVNVSDKNFLAKQNTEKTRTDIKMVSNKIYLVGRDSSSSVVKPFMTDEEQSNIENYLHPVVYGDILKDFIKKLFKWVQTHSHVYHNVPQNPSTDGFLQLQQWMTTELPKLNSKNIFAGGDTPNSTLNKIDINKVDDNDFDKGEVVERINSNQPEGYGQESSPPQLEIKGQKFCLDGACRVDIRVIDLVSGEILKSFSSENSNAVVAYTLTVSKLGIYLLSQGIDLPIPQFNDLENF